MWSLLNFFLTDVVEKLYIYLQRAIALNSLFVQLPVVDILYFSQITSFNCLDGYLILGGKNWGSASGVRGKCFCWWQEPLEVSALFSLQSFCPFFFSTGDGLNAYL